MSLQIKIHGATPKSGKSICTTCKHAKTVKGQNCEELIMCHLFAGGGSSVGRVPMRVSECGEYHPVNMPWLHEMEDMAWIVEARRRGPVGFEAGGEMEVVVTKPKDSKPDQSVMGRGTGRKWVLKNEHS